MILEKLAGTGHLYSFDQDINVINKQSERLKEATGFDNYTLVHSNFSELANYCEEQELKIDGGILMDLGLSSIQLDDPARGFSFNNEGPLDMRMDQDAELSAHDVVNKYREEDLANLIYKYGDERLSRRIAKAIVSKRPINTTTELADIVKGCHPKYSKIHPATRTFQALRVYVNKELEVLEEVLASAKAVLEPEARIIVLSFQSQEDRIAKWAFRNSEDLEILTKKPIKPSDEETQANPRARSVKLRAAKKI